MRYAWVYGQRMEAQPKMRGLCACGAEVVAKCGRHVVWHWAHLSKVHCDPWWESETEWHRNWKSRFPEGWQEIPGRDDHTLEMHFADVKTPAGLVIEFQRSTISPEEVKSREEYYGKMIWVVDGCKNDHDRFNFSNMRSKPDANGFAHFRTFSRSSLFKRWYSHKPVFIDFGPEHGFWRIAKFDPLTGEGIAMLVNIKGFVELASSGTTDFSSGGGPATQNK